MRRRTFFSPRAVLGMGDTVSRDWVRQDQCRFFKLSPLSVAHGKRTYLSVSLRELCLRALYFAQPSIQIKSIQINVAPPSVR
jgi:hypothetical protein